MNSLQKLYVIGGIQLFVQGISRLFWDSPEVAPIRLSFTVILMVISAVFWYEDIQLRKLSKIHLLWVLISPIGLLLYHVFFVTKNPVKK